MLYLKHIILQIILFILEKNLSEQIEIFRHLDYTGYFQVSIISKTNAFF